MELYEMMEKKEGHDLGWEISRIIAFVKANKPKEAYLQHPVTAFSGSEWNKILVLGRSIAEKHKEAKILIKIGI